MQSVYQPGVSRKHFKKTPKNALREAFFGKKPPLFRDDFRYSTHGDGFKRRQTHFEQLGVAGYCAKAGHPVLVTRTSRVVHVPLTAAR
jgi:hypothetical protein